jgi:predicted transcriptional regulator
MREAIEQYVAREESRERFKAEAEASWAAYQETGRHLTGVEVRAWLRTWGESDEADMSACDRRRDRPVSGTSMRRASLSPE